MAQKTLGAARPVTSKASLKRVISACNIAAIALDIKARGALDDETKRGRKSPLSMAALLLAPALAGRAIIDLNVIDQTILIAEAALAALAIVALF